MVITIRTRKMVSGSVNSLMKTIDDGFMPIISEEPGYIAYYVVDSGDG
ncbi:MAG TPA: antibiotic biosynthesis monooxygenase, partial [Dehalococcoidia bacterium]|nr:antibiotic biosynthesis monooxygenase [Dehalococcoidia bacterium]